MNGLYDGFDETVGNGADVCLRRCFDAAFVVSQNIFVDYQFDSQLYTEPQPHQ